MSNTNTFTWTFYVHYVLELNNFPEKPYVSSGALNLFSNDSIKFDLFHHKIHENKLLEIVSQIRLGFIDTAFNLDYVTKFSDSNSYRSFRSFHPAT